jgi:hypothetical protein
MQSRAAAQQAKLILKPGAMVEASILVCGGKEWRCESPWLWSDRPQYRQSRMANLAERGFVRRCERVLSGPIDVSRDRGGSSKTADAARMMVE